MRHIARGLRIGLRAYLAVILAAFAVGVAFAFLD